MSRCGPAARGPGAQARQVTRIAPGWYGIAKVKWLQRIEIRDTCFMGRLMTRAYMTMREEQASWGSGVDRNLRGPRALLKYVLAKGTWKDSQYQIVGVAWGLLLPTWRYRLTGSDH